MYEIGVRQEIVLERPSLLLAVALRQRCDDVGHLANGVFHLCPFFSFGLPFPLSLVSITVNF